MIAPQMNLKLIFLNAMKTSSLVRGDIIPHLCYNIIVLRAAEQLGPFAAPV
jgi:hypothetical protein